MRLEAQRVAQLAVRRERYGGKLGLCDTNDLVDVSGFDREWHVDGTSGHRSWRSRRVFGLSPGRTRPGRSERARTGTSEPSDSELVTAPAARTVSSTGSADPQEAVVSGVRVSAPSASGKRCRSRARDGALSGPFGFDRDDSDAPQLVLVPPEQ